MLEKAQFLIVEAFTAMWRNTLMTFAAVTTVAVSLMLLGSLGFVYMRIDDYGRTLPSKFEIRVFLKDGTDMDAIRSTASSLRALKGVKAAVLVPKDKAWDKWRSDHPEVPSDLPNPLVDSFKVTLTDLNESDAVAGAAKAMPTVDEVRYEAAAQNLVAQALRLTRFIGIWVGGLLFVTGGILIYNAIRLNVHARRLEIRTMQLVGASRATVRIPFLIEGAFQGIVGGCMASALMLGAYDAFVHLVARFSAFGEPEPFPAPLALLALSSIGTGYGVLCSWLAVRSPLRFR